MRPACAALLALAAFPGPPGRAADPVPAPQGAEGRLPGGHPPVPGAPNSQQLLAEVEARKAELARRPKTVEIELALGTLYLANGRILDAIDWYRQAVETGEPVWRRWLALPAAARAARPSDAVRRECARSSRLGSRELSALAEARLAAGDQAGGAFCLRQALEPSLEALSRRGSAWFLAGNPDQGVADHQEVLRRDSSRTESLYFIGAVLRDSAGEDLERLRGARSAWLELEKRDPKSPRLAAVAAALPGLEAQIRNGGKKAEAPAVRPPTGLRPPQAPPVAGPARPAAPLRPATPAPAPPPGAGAPRDLAARGDAAFQAGDYAAAVAAWRQAISADPWLAGELGLHARIAEAESRLGASRRR
jgi:tetratricopeptide (TPR) repeat protein